MNKQKKKLSFFIISFLHVPYSWQYTCPKIWQWQICVILKVCSVEHGTTRDYIYVVVNFFSQVIFVFLLFLGMVMYANEVETKEK